MEGIIEEDDDLAKLDSLTEDSLLTALKDRFCSRKSIYTFVGDILLAINPFQAVPGLYDVQVNLTTFQFLAVSPIVLYKNISRCLTQFSC